MTTKTDEQERADFEAWVIAENEGEYGPQVALLLQRNESGDYSTVRIQGAWSAWQAAIALDRQQRGEPVGLQAVAEKMYKALNEELAAYDPPIHHVRAAVQAYQDWVNFTAPQPTAPAVKESLTVAEPVKAPSDATESIKQLEALMHRVSKAAIVVGYGGTVNGASAESNLENAEKRLMEHARALLAIYGQPAQPRPTVSAGMVDRAEAVLRRARGSSFTRQVKDAIEAALDVAHPTNKDL